jgi:acetyl/propionyl-CoA carboxylase alpha subunit
LYVERRIDRPRHVEFQVLADAYGNVVHLFERECSIQRRHQKIVEETPSGALTAALRSRMGKAAVTAASASGYRNAGTIEFLLEGTGEEAHFYFLEMNTRLQVEHPITEEVTGTDLVRAQILVAGGEPLPWVQSQLATRGHAVECRVYAEDPRQGFLPQAGRLLAYREPQGPGIRVDAGVEAGDDIPVHYDPLIAKLVTSGGTREMAIMRASAAIQRFVVLGVSTNVPFLSRLLAHRRFRSGEIDTTFVEQELPDLIAAPSADAVVNAVAAAGWAASRRHSVGLVRQGGAGQVEASDPWSTLEGWRG